MSATVRPSWAFVCALLIVVAIGEGALYWIGKREGELADRAMALCTKPAGPVAKFEARFFIPFNGRSSQ